mgnify:CR=1 FL=1
MTIVNALNTRNKIVVTESITKVVQQNSGNRVKVIVDRISDHLLLANIGVYSHVTIDSHIDDSTIHFTKASITFPVDSVYGRTGAVVASTNDYTWTQIDKTTSDLADLTTKSHTVLTDIGTYSHANIDTHIDDTTIHFTKSSINLPDLGDVYSSMSPNDGDVLTYDTTNGWQSEVPSGGGAVTSVFGRTGAVIAVSNDYTWSQIDKTTSSIADITTKSHTLLTDIGTYTHANIDTHIDDTTIHFTEASITFPVTSVYGRTGAVVSATNDYTWAQVDKTTSSIADITTKSHTLLTDIGTYTHANIDTHIDDLDIHPFTRTGTLINPTTSTDDLEWDKFYYLDATTGGSDSLAVGSNCGNTGLMTGGFNTFIGTDVAMTTTSGASNVGIGANSMPALLSGSNNVGVGTNSLLQLTTGSGNFGLGGNTLRNVTTASSNVAIGLNTCRNTSGAGNVGLGAGALYTNTTGGNNIAIGSNTMDVGLTPSLNVGIGSSCLKSNSGSQNVSIGYNSGRTVTGDANVFLGYDVASTQTAISNELWIANSATTTPLLHGNFSTPHLKINGGFSLPYVAKTSTYTAVRGDSTVDCTANSFTVTLPTAVGYTGQEFNIKNSGTGTTITIDGTSAQTIDGNVSVDIAYPINLKVQSNGSNWIII